MSLLDRLLGTENPKLPVHQFMAALAEYERSAITKQNIVDTFDLDETEATALQDFLDEIDASNIGRAQIHDVLMLGESGLYTKIQVKNRLGV